MFLPLYLSGGLKEQIAEYAEEVGMSQRLAAMRLIKIGLLNGKKES